MKSVLQLRNLQKLGVRGYFSASSREGFKEHLAAQLASIKEAGTYKEERIITSPQSSFVSVEGVPIKVINFCANNYLGLANNQQLKDKAKEFIDKYGVGLSSVRFICGTQSIHKNLEDKLSKFHQREDTILYASCFDANAGLFEALGLTMDDAIFSDELNHASIIDGIRLVKTQKIRYAHRNMDDLEQKLKASKANIKLIVTDGVFSMDGNIAPLPDIIRLAKMYGCITVVDDCHATGFFGKTGRGTEEFYNLLGSVDIINSTLGKALGGAMGGYTTGPAELIALLRQKSRPYLFSNSLPPAVVATGTKVMDLLLSSNELIGKLETNTKLFREGMTKAGFTIGGMGHPICPVMIGDAKLATDLANELLNHGIYVIGFSYPVVPKGKARVRVQISAAHSEEDVKYAIEAFTKVGKKLNIIP